MAFSGSFESQFEGAEGVLSSADRGRYDASAVTGWWSVRGTALNGEAVGSRLDSRFDCQMQVLILS